MRMIDNIKVFLSIMAIIAFGFLIGWLAKNEDKDKDAIKQRVFFNSYDQGWQTETTFENYSRDWWFTNIDDVESVLKKERAIAEYVRSQM